MHLQIRVGMSVGHSPGQPQHTPDMKKHEDDITDADKRDAKRRIQGNVSLEGSPEGSGDDDAQNRRLSKPTINTMAASAM